MGFGEFQVVSPGLGGIISMGLGVFRWVLVSFGWSRWTSVSFSGFWRD